MNESDSSTTVQSKSKKTTMYHKPMIYVIGAVSLAAVIAVVVIIVVVVKKKESSSNVAGVKRKPHKRPTKKELSVLKPDPPRSTSLDYSPSKAFTEEFTRLLTDPDLVVAADPTAEEYRTIDVKGKAFQGIVKETDKFDLSRAVPTPSVSGRKPGSLASLYGPSLEEVKSRIPELADITKKQSNRPRFDRTQIAAEFRAKQEVESYGDRRPKPSTAQMIRTRGGDPVGDMKLASELYG